MPMRFGRTRCDERAWVINAASSANLFRISEIRNSGLPVLPLIVSAREIGHIKATPDPDGIYRRLPLLLRLEDRVVPCLSLAALTAYMGIRPQHVYWNNTGFIEIVYGTGSFRIPVDSFGSLLIKWQQAWDGFKHYSVVDLLSDEADPSQAERYKGKIIIIGVAATGLSDIGPTPLERDVVLSRVHSSALDTLINGRFIEEFKPFSILLVIAVVLSASFIAVASKLRLPGQALLFVAILGALGCISLAAFAVYSRELPLFPPLLIFVPTAAILMAARSFSVEIERKMVRDVFGRYVSDEIVEEILKAPGMINLKGEAREVTFLVSDLRGFTPLSEAHSPLVVVEVANRYFEQMTEIILGNQGTINEILGDGMLVFFGAPRAMQDHWRHAVACALEMQRAMVPLNSDYRRLGLPELKMGIGIHTGTVVVGSIGSEKRRSTRAMGAPST